MKMRATQVEQKQLFAEGAEAFAHYLTTGETFTVGSTEESPLVYEKLQQFLERRGQAVLK